LFFSPASREVIEVDTPVTDTNAFALEEFLFDDRSGGTAQLGSIIFMRCHVSLYRINLFCLDVKRKIFVTKWRRSAKSDP
jgi:hypothetical protein